MNRNRNIANYAVLIVLLGVFCTSSSSLFVRWATAPSLVLAAYRKTIVTMMLLPVVLLRCRDELRGLTRQQLQWCSLSGVILAIHFFTYFEGVNHTSITASQILTGMEAVFVALVMWASGKESLTRRCGVGIACALGGCALVALGNSGNSDTSSVYGNAMSLLGAMLLAAYSLIGSGQRKNMSNNVYTFLVYGISALVLNFLVLLSPYSFTGYGIENVGCAFCMAVCSSLLGHSVFNWSLKYISPTLVSVIKLLAPVLAIVWGAILLGEIPAMIQIAGSLLAIGGICLYTVSKAKNIEKIASAFS